MKMKKAITLIANETTYAYLATFENVEPMNEAVRHYKNQIESMKLRKDTKQNLLDILEYLKRYSCRFVGVSYVRKKKIAADLRLSEKTIGRLCKRLASCGFIQQHEMKRESDMQQTVNAIVIQPLPENEQKCGTVQQEREKMSYQKNKISLKQNLLLHNTYQPAAPANFYQQFKKFIQSTIGDNQSLISRLFGVYKAHTTVLVRHGAFSKEFVEQAGYEALKASVMATKTKNIQNLPGYFNGVLDKTLDRMIHEDVEEILSAL